MIQRIKISNPEGHNDVSIYFTSTTSDNKELAERFDFFDEYPNDFDFSVTRPCGYWVHDKQTGDIGVLCVMGEEMDISSMFRICGSITEFLKFYAW